MPWHAAILHVYVQPGEGRDEIARRLRDAGREVRFVDDASLTASLGDIEVLLVGYPPRIDWTPARRLRLVHFLGAGVDGFFPAHGLDPRVAVANARGIHASAIRDHVLAMILAFERDLPRLFRQQAAGRWEQFPSGSLDGRTVGVLGLGEVGRPIATACHALGMRVLGVRRTPCPPAGVQGVDQVFTPAELARVLESSDYVVVAVPLTPETRGLVDATALARLRPHAVVVHVARGGVVDEAALVTALEEQRIRGAAIDVFTQEPLAPASPLWKAPNVIVSPHVAGWRPDYVARALAVALENVERLEQGLSLRTPVDRAREY
jgi:phosphoglycerate dehydrogenase-like enzyme